MDSLQKKQRGATLLVSLVLLLLLTVLAVVSSRTATLQQRMAGNQQQQNLAFQAAEGGIAVAIFRLNADSANWPPNINDKKYLCGTAHQFADVVDSACTVSGSHGYEVTVTQVACSSSGSGICFDIESHGKHGENEAFHQQGLFFEQDEFGSERNPF